MAINTRFISGILTGSAPMDGGYSSSLSTVNYIHTV